jgi:hypothetical protein
MSVRDTDRRRQWIRACLPPHGPWSAIPRGPQRQCNQACRGSPHSTARALRCDPDCGSLAAISKAHFPGHMIRHPLGSRRPPGACVSDGPWKRTSASLRERRASGGGERRRVRALTFGARAGPPIRRSGRGRSAGQAASEAGLRACEIALLDWSIVLDARGRIADLMGDGVHIAARLEGVGLRGGSACLRTQIGRSDRGPASRSAISARSSSRI